jgi:hypothetical protein
MRLGVIETPPPAWKADMLTFTTQTLVTGAGFEPARSYEQWCLRPPP